MTDAPRYATLRDYLRVLRAQRLIIVLLTLVVAGGAVALALRQTDQYEAEAAVAFLDENVDAGTLGQFLPATQPPDQRAALNAQAVTQPEVLRRVQGSLTPPPTVGQLQRALNVQVENRTNNVVIRARWSNGRRAADIANLAARESRRIAVEGSRRRYAKAGHQLEAALKDLGKSTADKVTRAGYKSLLARLDALSRFSTPARIVKPAGVPGTPVSPRPVRDGVLGGLLGLTLGLLAAFVRDALDRRLRNAAEIRSEMRLPMLGHVGKQVFGRSLIAPNGRKALRDADFEAFRILRTNLEFLDVDHPVSTVLVTSALPEEGKSTVASALASAYVMAGKLVLLIECDLRRPTLAKRLALTLAPGLTDYLGGKAAPQEVVQTVELGAGGGDEDAPSTLAVITAGSPAPRPGELLASQRFKTFLGEVSEAYDVVVLDSSPLLPVGDTLELVPQVGGVVVCVRAQKTTRDQAGAARAALDRFPARPTGVVVTGVRAGDELDYGYYSYAYAYGSRA